MRGIEQRRQHTWDRCLELLIEQRIGQQRKFLDRYRRRRLDRRFGNWCPDGRNHTSGCGSLSFNSRLQRLGEVASGRETVAWTLRQRAIEHLVECISAHAANTGIRVELLIARAGDSPAREQFEHQSGKTEDVSATIPLLAAGSLGRRVRSPHRRSKTDLLQGARNSYP